MRKLKMLLLVALLLLVVGAAVVFVLENQQPLSVVVLGVSGPQLPVAVPIISAFLAGMILGPLLAAVGSLLRRRAVRSQKI